MPGRSILGGLIAAAFCVGLAAQLAFCLCLCADGALAARLVLWGLLSEPWGTRSVEAACALLRLRAERARTTPALELRDCVADGPAARLGAALRAHGGAARTEALALPGNPLLSAAGLEALCSAVLPSASSPLRALDLSQNPQLGDGAARVLGPHLAGTARAPSQLRVLRLAECGVTAEGARLLGKAASTSVLRTLDLSMNALGGAGAALASLLDMPLIQDLRLVDCGLADGDVAALATPLASSDLRSLDLAFNLATLEGVAALAEQLSCSGLQHLSLMHNRISMGEPLGRLAGAWVAQQREGRVELGGNMLSEEDESRFHAVVASLAI